MPDPSTPLDHPGSAATNLPNVELLHWPAHDSRRRLLAALSEPRLLLLAPNTPTPVLLDNLELCIPDDSPPNVVVTSITALQQRAFLQDAEPVLDDDGLLWFRGHWVAVSDAQIPVVDLLVQNYGRLVRNDDVRRTYHRNGGSNTAASLRTLQRRVAQRVAKVHLKLHVVPRRGVILAPADDRSGGRP